MKTALIVIGLLLGLLAGPSALNVATKVAAGKTTTETISKATKEAQILPPEETINKTEDIKVEDVKKIITLESGNMVVLRGPVTGSSVGKTMKQLREISRKLNKKTPIYLVLDTPGGSIPDGLDLIDFAKALPQKVHTITLFAASMGFQIAQNLDTRYIITNGTLMSHRARVEGLGGQVKGELESRYKMVRRSVDYLDYIAAQRMGMKLKDYEALVIPEYWVYGFDAVTAKAADEQVLLQCGETLDGTDVVTFDTFFGPVKVTFAKCPLIKEPEAIDLGFISLAKQDLVQEAIKTSIEDKSTFVSDYITTAKFHEIFR